MKCKSKGKANKEQPIITEENDAYAMVQNTSQTQDNTMEQPIVTEGNTAYGMVGSSAQPVASFDQQQQENNEQSAAGETFYEAVFPTGELHLDVRIIPNSAPRKIADRLPSVQQQANVTTIPEDPDYI